MLDIKFVRDNPEIVKKAARDKGLTVDVDRILKIDEDRRSLIQATQRLLEERNKKDPEVIKRALELSREKPKITPEVLKRALELKQKIQRKENEAKDVEKQFYNLLLTIPNIPKDDVKIGKDESENEVIKREGKPRKFSFTLKDHLELGELLDIIDVKTAAKVSGTRFNYLKNEAVLLEFALIQLAMEVLVKEGFTPVIPPVLIRQNITSGLGYWQAGGHQDYYLVYDPVCPNCNHDVEMGRIECMHCGSKIDPNEYPGFYLVGTAEHAIVPMHKDELFTKKDLPRRYVGFSSAFRREAGSYGKDTRGIFRVHQFDKVEMVSFVTPEDDDKEHKYLLGLEEKLFQTLDIPYQVVKMCTGDLGFPTAQKYDIEAWIPSQGKYREVTSVSTVTDFQSRRLNIKYQDGAEKKYVYILNGTAFAIGRTLIAILENYQNEDGSVDVPQALQKYVPFKKITPRQ